MRIILTTLLFVGASSMTNLSAELSESSTFSVQPAVNITPRFVKTGFIRQSSRMVDTIVLHSSYNSLGGNVYELENLIAIFRHYGVSSHYVINRDGSIYQLVQDNNISYHAGISQMPDGRRDVNKFSLGIELMNTRQDQYTEAQYESLQKLIVFLKARHPIKNIVGHGQIAPQRRNDPWNLNWSRINVAD